MKRLLKSFTLLSTLFFLVLAIAACEYETNEIVLAEGDWESSELHNQIAKFILEEGYEREVRIDQLDTALILSSFREGTLDIYLEMWSGNIPSYQDDLAEQHYHQISVNYDDNFQGLYIPAYLAEEYPGLTSVSDLPDYKHLFPDPEITNWDPEIHKAIVIGGPSGWSITDFYERKFANEDDYPGLVEHFTFRTSESTVLLDTTLVNAYQQENPWVGYHWEPSWILGLYDMVLLEDDLPYDLETGTGNPPPQPVTVVARDGFEEDHPELFDFFSQYETSAEITASGLAYMNTEEASTAETARWWLAEYEDLWSQWVPEEVHQRVMAALDEY